MKFKSDIEVQAGLKDGSNDIGTAGQILSSTGSQTNWIDQAAIVAAGATRVLIACKNTSGGTITKGTPVYQTGNVGATDVIEIAEADALISTGYLPAIGLLETDLINNAFGHVVITGELLNITTDPIDGLTPTTGDTIYLKSGGGLTLTKPTGEGNAIQNLGLVGKVSGGNAGSLTVASIMRQNDVPNLPTGKIWVGDGNTTVSDVVYLDETNGRMGIGTTSPTQKLNVVNNNTATWTAKFTNNTNNVYLSVNDANNYGIYVAGETKNYFSGNVGIGTTSPIGKLDVSDGTNPVSIDSGSTYNEIQSYNRPLYVNRLGNNTILNSGGGNVGIGTSSPSTKGHFYSATSMDQLTVDGIGAIETGINFASGGTTYGQIYFNNVSPYDMSVLQQYSTGSLIFGTNDTERMRIDSSGNVGIGTTSPVSVLEVYGGSSGVNEVDRYVRFKASNGEKRFDFYMGGTGNASRLSMFDSDGTTEGVRLSPAGNSYFNGGNVGIGTTSPDGKLTVSNGGAAGLEFFPEYTTNNNLINNYNRSNATYVALETRAAEHYWDIGTSNKMSLSSSGNLNVNGEIQGDSFSGPGEGLDNLLPVGYYATTPSSTGVLIKTNIVSNNYGFMFGELKLEQFNFASTQTVSFSATVNSNGTVITKAAVADIAITIKLFVYGGEWWIWVPTATTYITVSAFIYTGAGYQGQYKGFNEVYSVIGGSVPSTGVTGSVDIVADVYVTTSSAGGSGPFLPLAGGTMTGTNGVLMPDNFKLNLGTSSDLQIYHDGSNSYIKDTGTGNLRIRSTSLRLEGTDSSNMLVGSQGGPVSLYFNNSKKFETSNTGVSVTGNGIFTGNVGIGTTSPTTKLDVAGDSSTMMTVRNTGTTSSVIISNGSSSNQIFSRGVNSSTGRDLSFVQGTSEAMRITSSGNVGIGTTSPGQKLEVVSNTTYDGIQIKGSSIPTLGIIDTTNNAKFVAYVRDSDATIGMETNHPLTINTNNTERMRITSSGNVGIGTTSPSQKLDVVGGFIRSISTGANLVQGAFVAQSSTTDSPGYRGQGYFTYNEELDVSWYMGTPYTNGDMFSINRQNTTTSFDTGAANMNGTNVDNFFAIKNNGNVGIGTTSPGSKLEVIGRTKITQSADALRINSSDANGSYATWQNNGSNIGYMGAGYHLWSSPNNIATSLGIRAQTRLDLGIQESVHMTILNTGNVGIGTTSPQSKLQVDGGIQMADDTDTASADKVGTMRYRTDTEYVEVTGTELVTNGDFATDTDWSKGDGITISGGTANFTSVPGRYLSQNINFTNGAKYKINFEITAETSGILTVFLGAGNNVGSISGVGKKEIIATGNSSLDTKVYFGNNFTGSIDNVSVIEVTAEDASYADMCMQTGSSTYEWVNIVRNTY